MLARLGSERFDDLVVQQDGDLRGGALLAGRERVFGKQCQVDRPVVLRPRFRGQLIDQPTHLLDPLVETWVVAVPPRHRGANDDLARRPVVARQRIRSDLGLIGAGQRHQTHQNAQQDWYPPSAIPSHDSLLRRPAAASKVVHRASFLTAITKCSSPLPDGAW
jgi:hypothetical protein